MKLLIMLFTILLFTACQENELFPSNNSGDGDVQKEETNVDGIPNAVLKAFEEKYPEAKSVEWEQEGNVYEVEFLLNGQEWEAEFDKDGNWIATEKEIAISKLPEKVLEAVKSKFPGAKIEEAELVESAKFGTIYEVEFEYETSSGVKEIELLIDENGNILDQEQEDEDDENDDD